MDSRERRCKERRCLNRREGLYETWNNRYVRPGWDGCERCVVPLFAIDSVSYLRCRPGVSHLCTSMVSNRRQATQAHSMLTWLQKSMMPMKNPEPRIRVSAGWAYSACMPNGAWGTDATGSQGHIHDETPLNLRCNHPLFNCVWCLFVWLRLLMHLTVCLVIN